MKRATTNIIDCFGGEFVRNEYISILGIFPFTDNHE